LILGAVSDSVPYMTKRDSNWHFPRDWLCLLAMTVVPGVAALFVSILLPLVVRLNTWNLRALYGVGLGVGVISIVMLFVARLPLYKQRRFWSIGPTHLDRKHRRIYWLAYVFVAASLALLGVVWLRAHWN
jgi:hypothetical protein